MKFFKVHSQKMKNDKIICLQDKFNDIGPDCFDGFEVECLVLAETTKFVRNYAFSGVGECKIYLPKAIEEIEPLAFENLSPSATFYCVKGSYAEQVCMEHQLNISYEVGEVSTWKEQQQKSEEAEKQRLMEAQLAAEAKRKAEEEARRKAEEEARIKAEEEARLKAEQERIKAEEEARIKAEQAAKKKAEEEASKKVQTADNKGKTAPGTRIIRVNVLDEVKGPLKETMDYHSLPDGAKSLVVQNVIHMHRQYENNVVKKNYISEGVYNQKLDLYNLKQRQKTDSKPNVDKPTGSKSVNIHIYDRANGVRRQVVEYKDFPQDQLSYLVGSEAYMYKSIVNGRVQGKFVTKDEFDILLKGGTLPPKDATKPDNASKKVCPQCKAPLQSADKFCTNCGKKIEEPKPAAAPQPAKQKNDVKVCSKCGHKNEGKYYFCVACGNKI